MTKNLHVGKQFVSMNGYRIETPRKLLADEMVYPHKTRLRQKIEAGVIKPEPSLVANRSDYVRYYDPLEEKSLYRIFSELPPEEAGLIEFANEYGILGIGLDAAIQDEATIGKVEPVSEWRNNILKLRSAVTLWDNIQLQNYSWLNERVIWFGDKNMPIEECSVKYFDGKGHGSRIASSWQSEEALTHFKFGETERPARLYLQKQVNSALRGNTTNSLLFNSDYTAQINVITGKNLLAYLWLQLALAIEGNLVYRHCAACNKPFQVEPSERGKPKKFCTDACKSRDYRQKKKATSKLGS